MELHEINLNVLVEHSEWGVGEIIRQEGPRVVINFPNNPEEPEQEMSKSEALNQLKALPLDGLETAFRADPNNVLSWVYEGQIRLIGAALADLGGESKAGALQSRLENRILNAKNTTWKTWWDKARPAAKESGHFEMAASKPIKLLSEVRNIPIESAFPPPKTAARPSARTSTNRTLTTELELQRQAHFVELRQQRQAHAAELRLQQEHHAAELQLQRESHAIDLDQQRRAYSADLELQRESHAIDLDQQRRAYSADLELQRETHVTELERRDREEERLHNQIRMLRATIATNREESRLEIRRDMLDAMAETLKTLRQNKVSPDSLLRDVEAGIKLALQAGGAEFYGKENELVEYDPTLHEASGHIPTGALVKIIAPGALVPGAHTGNYLLLKARVNNRPEVK